MRTELEIQQKMAEMRSRSPEWFLSLSKMDMSPELQNQVTEHLPYIQAGMLIGLAWALGHEDKDLVSILFDPKDLPQGLKLADFDMGTP